MTDSLDSAPRDGTEVELRIGSLLPELWVKAAWVSYGGTRSRRVGWVSDDDGIYSDDSHFTAWRPICRL